jgi:hypothetical protein
MEGAGAFGTDGAARRVGAVQAFVDGTVRHVKDVSPDPAVRAGVEFHLVDGGVGVVLVTAVGADEGKGKDQMVRLDVSQELAGRTRPPNEKWLGRPRQHFAP